MTKKSKKPTHLRSFKDQAFDIYALKMTKMINRLSKQFQAMHFLSTVAALQSAFKSCSAVDQDLKAH